MKYHQVFLMSLMLIGLPGNVAAMHISEGFLPVEQSVAWLFAALIFFLYGMRKIVNRVREYPEHKLLLGLVAAFIFIISTIKIPSVIGSNSHITGMGLAAILLGPAITCGLSGIVLIFQALLLAHGGISTWGANLFSMGIIGGIVAWGVFKSFRYIGVSEKTAVFLAAVLGDWATYIVTACQLALAFPDPNNGIGTAFIKFISLFAITQIPLAILEGFLSVLVYVTMVRYCERGIISVWFKNGGR